MSKPRLKTITEKYEVSIGFLIKEAFYEGYRSYQTPCNAYTDVDSEWNESESKKVADSLMDKPSGEIWIREVKVIGAKS